jgi:L-asparaginase II
MGEFNPNWYHPVVELTRGITVESIHYGAAAVVNSEGELIASIGDPQTVTFLRSAAKPFQAMPLIEMGGSEIYGFTNSEIGLICSSHSGTNSHLEAIEQLQKKIGISEENLLCGTHPPMDQATVDAMLINGMKPTPNRHMCSGKHSGMLAYAKILKADLKAYLDITSPVQINILQGFSEMCSIEVDQIELGTDGCSAPVFAVPLYNAALGFARLSDPRGLDRSRQDACKKIFNGMTGSPFQVAGPGRFDTNFMQVMNGGILTKTGAEGYQSFGIPSRNGNPGMGIALKIADGDVTDRSRSLVGLEILNQLGIISREELSQMAGFYTKKILNWRKIPVGEIRPCFKLK